MATGQETKTDVPPNLALTALLSSGISIVSSVSYIILCVIALVYRFNCDVAALGTSDNAQYSWHLIYRVYIQDYQCPNALAVENLTQSQTVFLLITLVLGCSVLTLIASVVLTVSVKKKEFYQYMNVIVFAYITCWVGSLVVDLILATLLGMDYGYLTQQLRDAPEYIYTIDALRHGALVLMSVSLKGYATVVVNLVLICLLITYSCKKDASKNEQHSIHKVGAINAFEQPRRVDDNWAQAEPISPFASSFTRGQVNNNFVNVDDQPRSLPRSDYYPTTSQSFNRSDSWQNQPPSHGSRPFSYMDDIRRSVPLKPPTSPAPSLEPQWRRDPWAPVPPPVPAPDYSPHTPRRLKSALKPAGYM